MIGVLLVRDVPAGRRSGRIVEVEAYLGSDDRASHARFGKTARNGVMFGEPGRAYLYLVYGMHVCLNIVTEPLGRPAAVLIRAVEILEGVGEVRHDRARSEIASRRAALPALQRDAIEARIQDLPATRLASGPGLVGAAFALDTSMTGLDLCDPASPLRLEHLGSSAPRVEIVTTPRIGVGYAGEPWASRPLRFVDAGSPSLSRPLSGDEALQRSIAARVSGGGTGSD